MKSKRKTPKTLCMIVSILFVTLLFVPNSTCGSPLLYNRIGSYPSCY